MINWTSLRRGIASQVEHIRSTLNRLLPDLHADVTAATAHEAYLRALEGADRHTKTGALVRSLKLRKLRRIGEERYEIYHDLRAAPHALFVHWGTKPHEIRAKHKKALRFVWKGDVEHFWWGPKSPQERAMILRWMKQKAPGSIAHFRWPYHPGYKGDPYLVNARSSAARAFTRIAAQSWANVTRRFRRS